MDLLNVKCLGYHSHIREISNTSAVTFADYSQNVVTFVHVTGTLAHEARNAAFAAGARRNLSVHVAIQFTGGRRQSPCDIYTSNFYLGCARGHPIHPTISIHVQ